jgi:hypothetical protein
VCDDFREMFCEKAAYRLSSFDGDVFDFPQQLLIKTKRDTWFMIRST